jgi:hypothetical protein
VEEHMNATPLASIVGLLIALSVASERLVESIKGVIQPLNVKGGTPGRESVKRAVKAAQQRPPAASRLFLAVVIFIFGTSLASAGGVQIRRETCTFNDLQPALGNTQGQLLEPAVAAGEPVELKCLADVYVYGAEKQYGYVVFKVFNRSQKANSKPVGYSVSRVVLTPDHVSKVKASFALPEPGATYELRYHHVAFLDSVPLRSTEANFGGFLQIAEIERIEQFYSPGQHNDAGTEPLALMRTSPRSGPPPPTHATIYLNYSQVEKSLLTGQPLTFRWSLGPETSPEVSNIRFSYSLDPVEDWTISSSSGEATYNFLRPGNYTFQVKAKYEFKGQDFESTVAQYSFRVTKQIFAVTKSDSVSYSKPGPEWYLRKHYAASRALLVGVPRPDDALHFGLMDFVNEDLHAFNQVLTRLGFDDTLQEPTKKADVERALETLREQSGLGDRVIFYFSGHGTMLGDSAFLVSSDCKSVDKVATCISLEFLNDWVKKMLERRVRHVLIILDSCHAGLGVMSKAGTSAAVTDLIPGRT